MSGIPVLISDLAVILFSAGLITIIFKWLKQPGGKLAVLIAELI